MSDLPYDPQRDWFYRGREVGERNEQKRVIKLLEAEMIRLKSWNDYPAVNALMNVRAALIKEENN